MKIEVMVSTMNLKNINEYHSLIKKMNINDCVIINQCPNFLKLQKDINKGNRKLYSYNEKGLSKSRNHAIAKSSSDICVIADDDLVYKNNYEEIISSAYLKYPDADIIAFYVNSLNEDRPTSKQKEGKVNFLKSFKISSFQITFKRNSIINHGIFFDEKFGAGSGIFMSGEENIFLTDCLKKKMKIYFVNSTIADVFHSDSTWFKGFTKEYFQTLGACFYRMSNKLYLFLCIQYLIRKYKKYKKELSFFEAFRCMNRGKNKYIGGAIYE